MNILLTGGAGYIGSHICYSLIDQGHNVSTIDSLITGNKNLIPKGVEHLNADISDVKTVANLIQNNNFDVVMHLAAFTRVGESVKNPEKYELNNLSKAKIFLDTCLQNNLKKFIFSSTGSVYGNLNKNLILRKLIIQILLILIRPQNLNSKNILFMKQKRIKLVVQF